MERTLYYTCSTSLWGKHHVANELLVFWDSEDAELSYSSVCIYESRNRWRNGKTLKRCVRRADELAMRKNLAVSLGLECLNQYCRETFESGTHTYVKTHTCVRDNQWVLMFCRYCQVKPRGVVRCSSEPLVRQEGGGVSPPSLIKRTVRRRAVHNPGNLCHPRRKHRSPFDLKHSRTAHKYQR